MKKFTVTAYNGIGAEKKLAGSREIDMPETLDEAVMIERAEGEENPEDAVRDYYWASKVIEVQRQIRSGTTMSAKKTLAALEAYAKANPDSDVAKTLTALKNANTPAEIKAVENEGKETATPSVPAQEKEKPAARARK